MKERSMPILPPQITDRLKKAGDAAYAIRSSETVGNLRPEYQFWIDEIDAATAEAKRLRPDLYREGSRP